MRRWMYTAALAILALVASACTSGASPSEAASPTMATSPSAAASESASPSESAAESAAPSGEAVEIEANDTAAGEALVGPDGMTLYIFLNDEQGGDTSSCTDDCLANWPALTIEEGQEATGGEGVDGTFATITREDGTLQVTYEGWPLYYFAADEAPGDANGEGVGEVWYIATPSGEAPAS
jgi:predicted lipoprotein with Yx(FWY)xxD motif